MTQLGRGEYNSGLEYQNRVINEDIFDRMAANGKCSNLMKFNVAPLQIAHSLPSGIDEASASSDDI